MQRTDEATTIDRHVDDELTDRAIALLPEIGKSLYFAIARHPEAHGISLGQLKALGYLFNHAPCAVRDVADGLGISMPSASETVDRLVELGKVERTIDPVDRRRNVVAPTPEGVATLTRLDDAVALAQVELLAGLSARDRREFDRLLTALLGPPGPDG